MISLINQRQMSFAEWRVIHMEQNLLGRAPEAEIVPLIILLVMGPEAFCWMMYIAMAMKIPSYNVHIRNGVIIIVMMDTPKKHMNGLESHAWYIHTFLLDYWLWH